MNAVCNFAVGPTGEDVIFSTFFRSTCLIYSAYQFLFSIEKDFIKIRRVYFLILKPYYFSVPKTENFPIFLIDETERRMTSEGKVQITNRLINNKTKEKFKDALQEITWDDVTSSKQTDSAYEAFLNKFTSLCNKPSEKLMVPAKSREETRG